MKAVSYLAADREGNMQRGSLVLSLFLWLGERPACYDSTEEIPLADPETSADGMPLSTPTLGSSPTWSHYSSNIEEVQTTTILSATNYEPETTAVTDVNYLGMGDLHPALVFGIPAVLLIILLILLIFLIVRCRKKKQSKQGQAHELDLGVSHSAHPSPLLPDQASHELGSENCKSPIFEEDTPSVMEIEMEELDKWMNSLKRNAECEYLPPVKEEKDGNANPSDCES